MRIGSFILLLSGLAFSTSCSDDTKEQPRPPQAARLMPTPADLLLTFAVVELGEDRTRPIVAVNGGVDLLTITEVALGDYQGPGALDPTFTLAERALPASLAYNEALSLPVTFTPDAVGVHRAKVTVTSDAAELPVLTFELVGFAAPSPAPAEPLLAFFPGDGGVMTIGEQNLAVVRFANLGTRELLVFAYEIDGDAAFSFPDGAMAPSAACAAVACDGEMPAECVPVRVGYGMTVALGLPYDPASVGPHAAEFVITSNASNCPSSMSLHAE